MSNTIYVQSLRVNLSEGHKSIDRIADTLQRDLMRNLKGKKKVRRSLSAKIKKQHADFKKSLTLRTRQYLVEQQQLFVIDVYNAASESLRLSPTSKMTDAILNSNPAPEKVGDDYVAYVGDKRILDAKTAMRGKSSRFGYWRLFEHGGTQWKVSVHGEGRAGGSKDFFFVPTGYKTGFMRPDLGHQKGGHPGVLPVRMYLNTSQKREAEFRNGFKNLLKVTLKEIKGRKK